MSRQSVSMEGQLCEFSIKSRVHVGAVPNLPSSVSHNHALLMTSHMDVSEGTIIDKLTEEQIKGLRQVFERVRQVFW